ncbi:trypsin-like peptidase domain-containing protein [Streptomyces racemochromogenes]|uniref:Trypsin-like peptidase domain-containing protein n=1 Tax=Streptomyces racemochromogenes TaxID=67353 RepID=A0ABW7PMY8_9ACTN
MLRTFTLAAATAALLLPGGPLPGLHPGNAEASAGRWTAREAAAFWTPARMASALPVPGPPAPGVPASPAPGAAPSAAPGAGDAAAATPVPAGAPAATAAAGTLPAPPTEPFSSASPTPAASAPAAPASAAPAPAPAASAAAASAVPVPAPAAPALPAAGPVLPSAPAGVGKDFDGIPVVGRMFVMQGSGAYFCTASVVSSPGRNMVLSAAHCLLGSDTRQVAFVPQYTRANPRPYGMFPVLRDAAGRSKVWIASRYRTEGAAKAATLDVAFAQVGPDAEGEEVEDVVGANRLVTGATFNHPKVVLIGHPAPAPRPRACVNKTTKFTSTDPGSPGSFLRIDCTGYPGGTSGGPFITRFDEDTATGDVVGVIGGWETGGPTADTSYSAYFGAEIRKLYQSAVAGVRAE